MHCTICKNKFIITKSQSEFLEKQLLFEKDFCENLEREFNLDENLVWNKLLMHEALLLPPNKTPFKCIAGKCDAILCKQCFHKYRLNHILCQICKNRKPANSDIVAVANLPPPPPK